MGSASAGWLFSASRSGSAPVLLGKMRTSRSVSLATETAVGDAFQEAFVILYKGQQEKLLNLHKGFTPTPQDFFLLVNSTDAWWKERAAPKELPSEENQDSRDVWDPAECSVPKLDTELQRRESAVRKWACDWPPAWATGLWHCFPTKPSSHLPGPGVINIQNTSDDPAEADDIEADRNEL